jgi:hypothetical protein
MSWYKKARRVKAEYWKSVGNWVLVPLDKPNDRNLRPLGIPLELGIGQEVLEFNTKEEAEQFAIQNGMILDELV